MTSDAIVTIVIAGAALILTLISQVVQWVSNGASARQQTAVVEAGMNSLKEAMATNRLNDAERCNRCRADNEAQVRRLEDRVGKNEAALGHIGEKSSQTLSDTARSMREEIREGLAPLSQQIAELMREINKIQITVNTLQITKQSASMIPAQRGDPRREG